LPRLTCSALKKTLLFIILFTLSVAANAQKMYDHGVFWGRLALADTINSKLKWELHVQKRTQSAGSGNILAQRHYINIWPWLSYKLNGNTRLLLSPVSYFNSHAFYNNVDDVRPEGVKEYRVSLRLESEHKLWFFNYANRYSLEYRMRDLSHSGDYQPNWRARYMFKLEKRLFNVLSKKKPVSVFVSDEVLIQFGQAVKNNANIFDQNRINVGATYGVAKNIKFTASYLNILQQRASGKEFDNAHALWLIVSFENLFSQFKKAK
jgi:hypothetical protein